MLTCLTRRLRLRFAAVLAATYALCVIAPPLALAFTDGKAAAHCLNEDHHLSAVVHVHADGTKHVHAKPHDDVSVHAHQDHAKPHDHAAHEHATHDHAMVMIDHQPVADQAQADPQDSGKSSGNCCGLFCFSAVAFEMMPSIGVAPRGSLLQPALEARVVGYEPSRIDRPPITLLSF